MTAIIMREKTGAPFLPAEGDDMIVCRCEEVSKGDIRRAVHGGLRTLGEVRRFLRIGMGLCQGQSCQRLVRSIIVAELGGGAEPGALGKVTGRAPMRPVVMSELALSGTSHEEGENHEN